MRLPKFIKLDFLTHQNSLSINLIIRARNFGSLIFLEIFNNKIHTKWSKP